MEAFGPDAQCPRHVNGLEKIYEFVTLPRETIDQPGADGAGGPRDWTRKELWCLQRAVGENIREKLLAVGVSDRSLRKAQEREADFDDREDKVVAQSGGG